MEDGITLEGLKQEQVSTTGFAPIGTPVTVEEVEKRLSDNLYGQLSDGDPQFVLDAVKRAEIHTGVILSWLSVPFSLDDVTQRELVLMWTLYELHMALGHEEAGREYRTQFKDTVIAAYGSYPDSDNTPDPVSAPAAAVARPPRSPRASRLDNARRLTQ